MYFFETKGSQCKNTPKCRHFLMESLGGSHVYCPVCNAEIPVLENTTPLPKEFIRYIMEKYDTEYVASGPAEFDWDDFDVESDGEASEVLPYLEFAQTCEEEYFSWASRK